LVAQGAVADAAEVAEAAEAVEEVEAVEELDTLIVQGFALGDIEMMNSVIHFLVLHKISLYF
jgi:hypothetical protein